MKFTTINNVVINMDVESANNGQSIIIHLNSGTKFLFDIDDAQNFMYWLNELILKGCGE